MAGPTRLELATSGVTGRRSNQLNYDPASYGASEPHVRPPGVTAGLVCAAPTRPASPGWPLHAADKGRAPAGGRYRTRTCDNRRVKPALYPLS